jgi:hypothetical protein
MTLRRAAWLDGLLAAVSLLLLAYGRRLHTSGGTR